MRVVMEAGSRAEMMEVWIAVQVSERMGVVGGERRWERGRSVVAAMAAVPM